MRGGQQELNSYFKNQGRFSPKNMRPVESPLANKQPRGQNWARNYVQEEQAKKPLTRQYKRDSQDGRQSPKSINDQGTDINNKYFQARRPGSHNNYQDEYRSNKGIGLTSKMYRPSSNDRQREIEQKQSLTGSQSQGQLLKKDIERISRGQLQNGPRLSDQGKRAELSQYQKLHEKLNTLENKIAAMKINLEKKKAEKQSAMEKQRKQKRVKQEEKVIEQKQSQKRFQRIGKLSKDREKEKEKQRDRAENNALKGIVTQVPKQNKELHNFDHNPYSPRHNMYYVSQIVKAYKQQQSLARQHLLTSMQFLRIMQGVKRNSYAQHIKALNLEQKPMYKGKKTVVFDLDQTLIHCNESTNEPYDVALPIKFPTGEVIEAGINIRPHAVQMLRALAVNFEVIVFTASHSCYANVVLDHLDPQRKIIQHRLYRQHCFLTPQKMYIKDLRIINRKESDMVLIDNAAYSYAFQLENGIPIIPYYEGKNDFELKALQSYIQRLIWVPDVREVNRKIFKLGTYKNYDDPERLVKQLYNEWIH